MDGYQFIAAILQSVVSLAWPAAIFGSVWLFCDKLRTLLPLLRMKYKDLDVSFRLDEAEKEAAKIPPTPPSPDLEPTPEEKTRFEQLARISPRAAIVEIRSELEETVKEAVQRLGTFINKPVTLLTATRILRRQKVIDEATSALLDDLRAIGNDAVHNTSREFTTEEALRMRKLADQVIQRLSLVY
jgi:Domain of unknown function (DUF4145)